MGYRIRVLGIKAEQPDLDYLQNRLRESKSNAILQIEAGEDSNWEQLVLSHPNGPEIALIEYNPVVEGELGQEELQEFIEEVSEYKPITAAHWLEEYLPKVKVIYAFQLLSGTEVEGGWEAVHALQSAIWTKIDGILQADSEGFSNEDGYYILWQFSEGVKGKWKMAVLQGEKWIAFEMDLGNQAQREDFLKGKVPVGVRLIK
ncbi:MAG TPA: hypothetical protein VFP71_01735 [Candidatus Angelobacter sp.]|nr:hypothetical protein [Candidatus Angelobacter sp.]